MNTVTCPILIILFLIVILKFPITINFLNLLRIIMVFFALYKDVNYSIEKAVTSQNAPFILYDLLNQKLFLMTTKVIYPIICM